MAGSAWQCSKTQSFASRIEPIVRWFHARHVSWVGQRTSQLPEGEVGHVRASLHDCSPLQVRVQCREEGHVMMASRQERYPLAVMLQGAEARTKYPFIPSPYEL